MVRRLHAGLPDAGKQAPMRSLAVRLVLGVGAEKPLLALDSHELAAPYEQEDEQVPETRALDEIAGLGDDIRHIERMTDDAVDARRDESPVCGYEPERPSQRQVPAHSQGNADSL